jgi:hypothetical protein
MRRRDATFGDFVAAVSGVALIVSLFFAWYGFELGPVEASVSGWKSLTAIDIGLAVIGTLAVAHWALRRTGRLDRQLPVSPAKLVALAGAIAIVLVALRIIDLPNTAAAADLDGRRVGTFLALFAGLGIVLGATASLRGAAGTPVVTDRDRSPDEP